MQGRTFLRTMLDNLFVNNTFCKVLSALVKFCKEQMGYGIKELKFYEKMPLNKIEQAGSYRKFIFNSMQNNGVNSD